MTDFLREMGRALVRILRGLRDPEIWAKAVLLLLVWVAYYFALDAVTGLVVEVAR